MERQRTQYQHYVPRFILRNFVVNKSSRSRYFVDNGQSQFREQKSSKGRRVPPEQLNVYHIETAKLVMAGEYEPAVKASTVDHSFGQDDLYIDPHHPDHNHIEKKLSALESAAAIVVRKLVDAVDDGSNSVQLVRRDLNTLRKFLFIMTYRQTSRGEQFSYDRFDDATRKEIDKHIRQHLHPDATARDVWLQNIKEIIDTDYWKIPENPRIFLPDRAAFEFDMKYKRVVVWRTSANNEFISPANGWGLQESIILPSTDTHHTINGNVFEWIRIFSSHPRFSIVLVSTLIRPDDTLPEMPMPEFLKVPLFRFDDAPFPSSHTQYAGLSPAAQAALLRGEPSRRQYIRANTSIKVPWTDIDGKILESRVDDVFTIPLPRLSTELTHRVNGFLLENASSAVMFFSPVQLYRSITAFEQSPIWDHKLEYSALKRALRAFFQSADRTTETEHPLKPITLDRRLIWVRTPSEKKEEVISAEFLGKGYRAARQGIAVHILGETTPSGVLKRSFYYLYRCHDDTRSRNEEAAVRRATLDASHHRSGDRTHEPDSGSREKRMSDMHNDGTNIPKEDSPSGIKSPRRQGKKAGGPQSSAVTSEPVSSHSFSNGKLHQESPAPLSQSSSAALGKAQKYKKRRARGK